MKAVTMDVLNIENPEEKLFGVKIKVSKNRDIFLMKDKSIRCSKFKSEAHEWADKANEMLIAKPELQQVFNENKTIKVFTMRD